TDHSHGHPSPRRERSKGPSAPEAKPLPTPRLPVSANAATCGKCFLRVHAAMVEFLHQDRLLIGPRTGCPSPTAPPPQESCAPAPPPAAPPPQERGAPAGVAYQAVSAAPARGETRT